MLFQINPQDITVTPSYAAKPTSKLHKAKELIVAAVGPFTTLNDGSPAMIRHIETMAEIACGHLSDQVLAQDFTIGYIQAISLGSFFCAYSGAKSNAGSVDVKILDDTGRVFPDYDDGPVGQTFRPWTAAPADRFKYSSIRNQITANTSDGPGFFLPMKIRNGETSADNFLEVAADHRQICCALVMEDPTENPKRRFLGHSIWDIDLVFHYKWKKGEPIVDASGASVTIGKFAPGPPANADLAKMLEDSFLGRRSYNQQATDELNLHLKAGKSNKKTERKTWSLSTPQDFFTP